MLETKTVRICDFCQEEVDGFVQETSLSTWFAIKHKDDTCSFDYDICHICNNKIMKIFKEKFPDMRTICNND